MVTLGTGHGTRHRFCLLWLVLQRPPFPLSSPSQPQTKLKAKALKHITPKAHPGGGVGIGITKKGGKMDTSGIEPDPSRKFSAGC